MAGGPVQRGGDPHAPVVVVGAGPVGLTAALSLRARGLPAVVVEADPSDRVRPGSRALYVHRASLSILDQLDPGLGARIGRYGVVWRIRRTTYRGREVYTRRYPPARPSGLPPFTSLRQVDTERFLLDACRAAGVAIHWAARIRALESATDGVTLTAEDGRTWHTSHVIAADGARSVIRQALGIELEGNRTAGRHVVVDIDDPTADPTGTERVLHYEHPGLGGRTVLRVPFAGGFQIDLQCRDDDTPATFGTAETARQWLPGVIGTGYDQQIRWVSTYRFRQVVAGSFTDPSRRVLLVGEAAHLFPPFGARGMNSGIADADAAADAIAGALADPGQAAHAIEGFAAARRAAAVSNSRAAGAALAHLRPGPMGRAAQRVAATLAPLLPWCGSWLEHAPYGQRRPVPFPRRP